VETITETPPTADDASGRRRGRVLLWAKYAAGSVVATVLSQIAFTVTYGLLDSSAAVASVVAFFVGAVPNYLLNKAWAWKDRGETRRAEVLSYILVIAVTNLLAIGMTTLADAWVRSHVSSHGVRTLLVDGAYLASYGVMFVVKFLLFDGLVFSARRSRHQVRSTTRA
jgi:putative flippase GtrA